MLVKIHFLFSMFTILQYDISNSQTRFACKQCPGHVFVNIFKLKRKFQVMTKYLNDKCYIYLYSKRFSRQKIQKDPMQPLGLLFFHSNKYVQHLRRLVVSNLCKIYVMIFSCPFHPILLYIYQNNVCKHGLCLQAWDSI